MLNHSSTKVPTQGPNQRQIYKNKKLEETSEIYYCECGKNYLTFSALYLHARNKHSSKLTTKRTSQNCKIELQGDKTIITYFTSSPSIEQPSPVSKSRHKSLSNQIGRNANRNPQSPLQSLKQYIRQAESALSIAEKQLLSLFENYFQCLIQTLDFEQNEQLNDVTLFFNEFLTFYLPRHVFKTNTPRASSLQQAEATLVNFYKWLKLHGLTKYELIHQKSYTSNVFRHNQ